MNMIEWPAPNEEYESTGEGGLYAFLVIPSDERIERADKATVCQYVHMTAPDHLVAPDEVYEKFWEPYDSRNDAVWNARRYLDQLGRSDLSLGLGNAISYDELSVPLHASVYLGSTGEALIRRGLLEGDAPDDYFHVTFDHLTSTGKALFLALEKAYAIRPTILTFLDT